MEETSGMDPVKRAKWGVFYFNEEPITELPMKALLVGDNSSNLNWGGRGGSLALRQVLSQRFDIRDIIPGSMFQLGSYGSGYIQTLLPQRYNWILMHLVANRRKRKLFEYYVRFEELFGAKDFISSEPEQSAENILRYRNKYSLLQEIYRQAYNADLLILNGEGDMVFTTPPRREALFLLGMAALGLRLGKKVAFVNSLLSDCPKTGRNPATLAATRRILAKCHAVVLRDRQSLDLTRETMPEISPSLVPDSLFTWYPVIADSAEHLPRNGDFILPFPERLVDFGKLDFSMPYICVGGSAAAWLKKGMAIRHFSRLVDKLKKLGYPVYLTENCGRDGFLQEVAEKTGTGFIPVYTPILMCGAILANARLFISGRYHPSIFASMGGTPCIFLRSSAHKMHSLQKLLEYEKIREFSVFPNEVETDEMLELSKKYLDQGETLRSTIQGIARKRCAEAMTLPDVIYNKVAGTALVK
jgi:polysaccharide pyruvyl transferase WcaK-like protein